MFRVYQAQKEAVIIALHQKVGVFVTSEKSPGFSSSWILATASIQNTPFNFIFFSHPAQRQTIHGIP